MSTRPKPTTPRLTFGLLLFGILIACQPLAGVERIEYQECSSDADCGGSDGSRRCVLGRCQPVGSGGGTPGFGGAGGNGPTITCTAHMDCVDALSGQPSICRNGICVSLVSNECPRVLGLGENFEALRQPEPLVLGGFAAMDRSDPLNGTSLPIMNYEMALSEFNEQTLGGLGGGAGGSRRPVLLVLCNSKDLDLDASVGHLAGTLRVPAIIAPLSVNDQYAAVQLTRESRVLFMSPLEADSRLDTLGEGRVWHMLGKPESLGPITLALFERAQAFVNRQRAGTPDADPPLRVALIEADYLSLQDLAGYVYPRLSFNGKTAAENQADGTLQRKAIDSELVHSVADAWPAVEALEANPPHIIIALTTSEFFPQMPFLETDWSTVAPEQGRPFYILSAMAYKDPAVITAMLMSQGEVQRRAVGVNHAAYADSRLYDLYLSRLSARNKGFRGQLEGNENYYDAAYYLLYALAAAGNLPEYTGDDLLYGLKRVVDPTASEAVDIGPGEVNEHVRWLEDPSYRMQLVGTMGPPGFDFDTGTRSTDASAWCVTGSYPNLQFTADVLRYDRSTGELVGDFTCFPGF